MRTVLVTGASRGIGREIAIALARSGAGIVGIHCSTVTPEVEQTALRVEECGATAVVVAENFAGDPCAAAHSLATRFLDRVQAVTGDRRLDVLVNNAGVANPELLPDVSQSSVQETFDINAYAPLFLIQAVTKNMGEGGRIVNVSSALSRVADSRYPAYSASKAALNAFTVALAPHLGKSLITINAVLPGYVDTEKIQARMSSPERKAQAESRTALGRIGTVHDIADVVDFLASEKARWITGQTIDVSGGLDL